MVTAGMDQKIQLEALRAGASDYVLKPFNFELLKSKIASVLDQKSSLVKKYQKQITIALSQPEVESADEKFIRQFILEVERDLTDSTLSVEILAGNMHMTRVGLYKKILAITGYSPTEYIRHIRLKRAMHLIQHSSLSISEIAYEVGFGNPKQFTKYFKATFDNLPSYYRKKL
ncbi:HTH-type transcriptional activator RhaS [compost metagenome]